MLRASCVYPGCWPGPHCLRRHTAVWFCRLWAVTCHLIITAELQLWATIYAWPSLNGSWTLRLPRLCHSESLGDLHLSTQLCYRRMTVFYWKTRRRFVYAKVSTQSSVVDSVAILQNSRRSCGEKTVTVSSIADTCRDWTRISSYFSVCSTLILCRWFANLALCSCFLTHGVLVLWLVRDHQATSTGLPSVLYPDCLLILGPYRKNHGRRAHLKLFSRKRSRPSAVAYVIWSCASMDQKDQDLTVLDSLWHLYARPTTQHAHSLSSWCVSIWLDS